MFARLKAFLGSHSHSQSHHGYKGHLFQEDLQHIHSTLNEAAVFNASLRQMAADADKAAAALDGAWSREAAFYCIIYVRLCVWIILMLERVGRAQHS